MTSGRTAAISRNRNGRQMAASSKRRLPIARRPTAIDVADDHFFAFQAHRFNHLRQQLTGAAHKRFALGIFISAGRLADEHQTRLWIAVRVHDLRAPGTQRASGAVSADIAPDVFESFRGRRQRRTWRGESPKRPSGRGALTRAGGGAVRANSADVAAGGAAAGIAEAISRGASTFAEETLRGAEAFGVAGSAPIVSAPSSPK